MRASSSGAGGCVAGRGATYPHYRRTRTLEIFDRSVALPSFHIGLAEGATVNSPGDMSHPHLSSDLHDGAGILPWFTE